MEFCFQKCQSVPFALLYWLDIPSHLEVQSNLNWVQKAFSFCTLKKTVKVKNCIFNMSLRFEICNSYLLKYMAGELQQIICMWYWFTVQILVWLICTSKGRKLLHLNVHITLLNIVLNIVTVTIHYRNVHIFRLLSNVLLYKIVCLK